MTSHKFVASLFAGLLVATAGFSQPPPGDYQPDASDPNSYGDASAQAPVADPPSRVARLSVIQGAVSFVPSGENDWVPAEINRPLISGDKLWTDNGARAELQIGSSAIRVDAQTSFNFLDLDDNMAQIELTQGTINLRVRRIYDGQTYEVDTPTLAFVINRVGEYRIDISPDGNGTMVTAFRGGGDAYGEAGARFRIEEGQSVRFNNPQLSDYVSNPVPQPDDFDRFCFDRDGLWDNSPSRQFVSEDTIGYADLDNNGSWDTSPDYGNVWYPSQVDAGWTPYSNGNWSWVGGYGWTWVDAAPWGFAPFHYGRWAWINNRWGWCPGPVQVRSYWAPALVAFVGVGGARLGFSAGSPVGWFPLGPRDVFVPSYRVSRNYFTNVNIHNTTINNVTINNFYGNYQRGNFDYSRVNYANRNIANAITAVPGNVFTGARQVRGATLPVNRETFANARVSGFAAVAPTRASLAFDPGNRRGSAPPQAVQSRNIIAATRPPAPMASFAQRQAQLQRDPGRAISASQLRTGPTVIGNGAQARSQFQAERPNVNVVTRNGMPARTAAPAIGQRGGAPVQAEARTANNPAFNNARNNVPANNANREFNPQNARSNPQNNSFQSPTVTAPPTNRPQPGNNTNAPQARPEFRSAPVERGAQSPAITTRSQQQLDESNQRRQMEANQQQQMQRQQQLQRQPQDVQQRQQQQREMMEQRQQQQFQRQQQESQQRPQQFQQQQEMQQRQQQFQQRQPQERQAPQQQQRPNENTQKQRNHDDKDKNR
jgi:hypothetical protein